MLPIVAGRGRQHRRALRIRRSVSNDAVGRGAKNSASKVDGYSRNTVVRVFVFHHRCYYAPRLAARETFE